MELLLHGVRECGCVGVISLLSFFPLFKSKMSKKHQPRKPLLSEQKLRNIRTGEMTTLRVFEDTDDEDSNDGDSYPFSDLDETYQEILTRIH